MHGPMRKLAFMGFNPCVSRNSSGALNVSRVPTRGNYVSIRVLVGIAQEQQPSSRLLSCTPRFNPCVSRNSSGAS